MATDRDRRVEFCPHCSNRTPHTLLASQHFRTTAYYDDGGEPRLDEGWVGVHYMARCETCEQVRVYGDFHKDAEFLSFVRADLLWPEPEELHHAVPLTVASIYEEAARISDHAPNAYATQVRRALEAVCDDRGARKGSLQQRLRDLVSRGEIPPLLGQLTDVLRLLGNMGAHDIEQSVKPWHVSAIRDFFKAVVEYVYVAPFKLKEFRNRLAEIERRNAGSAAI